MLYYNLSPKVEAFSTNKWDAVDFDVVLPLHQAHSANVRRVPEEIDDITGVDALITNQPGLRIGVKTADCVPVLLFDERNNAVAAVHSGWRGTVKNILAATMERMQQEFGTKPAEVKAVIGPCIHQEAFEVGDGVYEAFAAMLGKLKEGGLSLEVNNLGGLSSERKNFGGLSSELNNFGGFAKKYWSEREGREKWHINLPAVCRHQLFSLGVKTENIEVRPECTFEQADKFFSARRLGKEFDRQRIINCVAVNDNR